MSSNWDWQVFCKSTIEDTVYPSCFGPGGDTTYFEWLLSAWGWTLSVAALGWIIALVFGSLMGIARTTPSVSSRPSPAATAMKAISRA